MKDNILGSIINRGKYIINTFSKECKNNKEDFYILLMLWKNLETLEGIDILLERGLVNVTNPLLRVLLENSIYIEWILKEHSHTTDKLRQIEFCYLKTRLKFYNNSINKFKPNKNKENLKKMIYSEKYKLIIKEWDNFNSLNKRTPNWYSLFGGPKNLRELSKLTDLEQSYLTIYSLLSENVHCLDLFDKFEFSNGFITLDTIDFTKKDSSIKLICYITSINYISITKYFDKNYKESDIFKWSEEIYTLVMNK